MKETEEDRKNGKIFHVHGLKELILLKCPDYPKQYTNVISSLLKFQWHFFTEIKTSKIYIEPQRSEIAKAILREKNRLEGITLLDFNHITKL